MQVIQRYALQGDTAIRCAAGDGPTILMVEDAPDQYGLALLLVQAFPRAFLLSTTCVRDALEALALHTVDIAVIDLQLPDGSGIDVVTACTRSSPLTRCVIATTYDDDDHLMPALAAGALGYVLRDQPERVLIQQMRLLAEGIPPLAPSVARRLVRQFAQQCCVTHAPGAREPDVLDGLIRLSHRERQVLTLIAKGMHIGEVARLLHIATNTVCSHIKSIYRKRNLSSRAEAALEAKRLGLV